MARYLVKHVQPFIRLTEVEKSSISYRSTKLFTISNIKYASKAPPRKSSAGPISAEDMEIATEFWRAVCDAMPDLVAADKKKVATSELRFKYVRAHGVALQAIGLMGAYLSTNGSFVFRRGFYSGISAC